MSGVAIIPRHLRRLTTVASLRDQDAVWISGESGSGKSAIARWLHERGPRSAYPFVEIKAFDPIPLQIRSAGMGTLYFPELETLDDLTLDYLQDLLRYRSITVPTPNGNFNTLIHSRVIISSLATPAEHPQFSEFAQKYRIHLPPLRARMDEFEDLSHALLDELVRQTQKHYVHGISTDAIAYLKTQDWRGNIRELREAIRAALLANTMSRQLEASHFIFPNNELKPMEVGLPLPTNVHRLVSPGEASS